MTPDNIFAFLSLVVLAYQVNDMKRWTAKWNDDRLLDRATGFFLGAAVVVLFV